MTDRLTPAQRHRCMSHIRSRNTKPELKVRQWLWQHGYRYRLCVKGVPGKPDIVLRKYRTAIFVNGCFWHGHGVELSAITIVETFHETSLHETFLQPQPEQPHPQTIINSPCCKIPQTNREFWVNKIKHNQERDQRNYQILHANGWQVIVVWECQLSAKLLETTMLKVEQHLLDNYIATLHPKRRVYTFPTETSLPIAAENPIEYATSSSHS